MTTTTQPLDPGYVQKKRQQLMTLRDQLRSASRAAQSEESAARLETSLQPHEPEDDAQKLDRLDTEGELVSRNIVRLERVERALAKIEDGTYGYSDVSGHRIPDVRLDAIPDATTTVAEQEAAETRSSADRKSI